MKNFNHNFKKTICLLLLFCMLLSFCGCSTEKCPSTTQIQNDLSSIKELVNDGSIYWEIVSIQETLAKELDHQYETSVEVKLKNEIYESAYKNIDLTYSYYDKGGWVLEDWNNLSNVYNAKPVKGVDENYVLSWMESEYEGTIELISHETDLEAGTDSFIFKESTSGLVWDEESYYVIDYCIDEDTGLWEKESFYKEGSEKLFNEFDGWFCIEVGGGIYDDYHDYICYYVKDLSSNPKLILCVDIAIDDYDVQGHDFSLLPEDTLHTDKYVCYEKELISFFHEESNSYWFEPVNFDGDVTISLGQDGIQWFDEKVIYTTDLSSLVKVPAEVSKWINDHLENNKNPGIEQGSSKNDTNSFLGTWICEKDNHRKDTLIISEENINWKTEYPNGQSESATYLYNDLEFYDSNTRLPYKFENKEIVVTLLDGSKITFKRK